MRCILTEIKNVIKLKQLGKVFTVKWSSELVISVGWKLHYQANCNIDRRGI